MQLPFFLVLNNFYSILLRSFPSNLLGINCKINELGAIVTFWRVNLINFFLLLKVTNEAVYKEVDLWSRVSLKRNRGMTLIF